MIFYPNKELFNVSGSATSSKPRVHTVFGMEIALEYDHTAIDFSADLALGWNGMFLISGEIGIFGNIYLKFPIVLAL